MRTHLIDDGLSHRAFQQCHGAMHRNTSQHPSQLRIPENMPDRPRLPVTVVEVSCSLRILPEVSIRSQHRVKTGTDLESLLGQADGRLEQSSPGQFPVLLVYLLQHANNTRYADRASTHSTFHERHGLAIRLEKQIFIGCSRSSLAAIVCLDRFAIEVHQERTTTNATGLRFNQRKYHLHSDGGIQGTASSLEDLITRISRQRIGDRHGKRSSLPAWFSV